MFGDTYEDCLDECRRRPSCTAVRYHNQMKYCSLLDGQTDVQSMDTSGPLCVYSTVGNDDRDQHGSCADNQCEKHETCANPKNQKSDEPCVITECLAPRDIANAQLLSSTRAVGTRNRYKCMIGFMGSGNPAIDCLTNGSWSFTDFHCLKMCQPPKTTYRTADLVKEWMQPDRVAHFRCKTNYSAHIQTFQLTCNSSGSWVHLPFGHLPCYREGQVYFEKNTTKVLYRAYTRNITSATEAKTTCHKQAGSLHTVWWDVAKEVETKFSFDAILTGLNKTGMKKYDLLKNCFEIIYENSSQIDKFKPMSYDDQVHEIQRNKNTYNDTEGCKTATLWKSGEPNGGDKEECIFRMKKDRYLMYDVPCDRLWQNITICFVCQFKLEYV